MTCVCGSERIASVDAKCSDMCYLTYGEYQNDGYVPSDLGIGRGDYIDFDYCLDCGRIQSSQFPIPESAFDEEE